MKNLTRIRSFLLLFLAFLSSAAMFSCSSQEEEVLFELFPHHYDLLAELFQTPPEATYRLKFVRPEHAKHLLQGWSEAGEELRWANAERAELYFYHDGSPKSKKVEFTWKTLPSSEQKKQEVTLFVNGKEMKTLAAKRSLKSAGFRIPAADLYPGFNLLTFQFSYTGKPNPMEDGVHEGEDVSVAFNKIEFKPKSSHEDGIVSTREDRSVAQKTSSGVALFKHLPDSFDLDIEYQLVKGAKASIELVDEQGETQRFSLPSGKTHVTRRFSFPKGGFYRIHAISTGRKHGHVLWKKFHVRTRTAQPILQKPEKSFVKRLKRPEQQQDILLYVIDTLRADHVGCYGYVRDTTPAIDAFAREHARYANAYATSPWTKPSGASLLTGLLPRNHQTTRRDSTLPEELVTLAEILQTQGYYTAAFMTNGAVAHHPSFRQGFDTFLYMPEDTKSRAVYARAAEMNKKFFRFLREYTAREERKPLFMLFWSSDPHDPYTPPEDLLDLFESERYEPIETNLKLLSKIRHEGLRPTASQVEFMKARYDQEIFDNDRAFGQILKKFKDRGMYQDLTIFLTADHGDEFFEHGGVGHSLTLYNEQLRVPFIVKSAEIEPGVYDRNVQITDIYPTILDALGVDEPYPLDGVSLMGPPDEHRVLFFENDFAGNDLTSRLDRNKKVIVNKDYSRPPSEAVLPVFEFYAADDIAEQKRLKIGGFEDLARAHEIAAYLSREHALGVQGKEFELSPELDRKLRELGYTE